MPLYESTFIARQDISSADVDKLTEQFSGIITAGGGKIIKTEYWGLRSLAYKVKKNKKGHYVMLGIEASPAALKEMERNIGLNEDVIRHLTVRVEEIEKSQSPVMTASSYDTNDSYEKFGAYRQEPADAA